MIKEQVKSIHPLLMIILNRLKGAGEVVAAADGHLFFQPAACIKCLSGAMDMKKEGQAAGVRIIVRKVRKRANDSKYKGMPWYQIYVLPIVKKNVKTMTAAERKNIELNTQALRMAHAVMRDPKKVAYYTELHEAHKCNPQGYKKLYPNLFGFLVATFRMELENQEIPENPERYENVVSLENAESTAGIRQRTPRQVHGIRKVIIPQRTAVVVVSVRHTPYFARAA